jgi:hypothetical protein
MKIIKHLTVLIAITLLSGCAAFVKNNIPNSTYIPHKIEAARQAEMTFSVKVNNPPPMECGWQMAESKLSRDIRKYFMKSGYFTEIRESDDKSEFHIDFEVTMNPSPYTPTVQLIAGSSLFLIPSWCTNDMELDATVYEHGRESSTFRDREEILYIGWLPLAAISPFANDIRGKSKIRENYCFYLLNNLEEKKILPVRTHGLPPTIAEMPKNEPHDIDKDLEPISSGSGFFITKDGYLLTNYHVVDGAKNLRIKHNGKLFPAYLVAHDRVTDLALLKTEGSFGFLEISNSPSKLGEEVFTTGYPNPDVQGSEIKYTEGNISSIAGLQDDARLYQISVPIQPGNSGGPLVTKDGKVTGMIVSKLSDLFALKTSGSLPQNVNYAIKNTYMKAFLFGVNDLNLQPTETNNETAIQKAKSASAMILAY